MSGSWTSSAHSLNRAKWTALSLQELFHNPLFSRQEKHATLYSCPPPRREQEEPRLLLLHPPIRFESRDPGTDLRSGNGSDSGIPALSIKGSLTEKIEIFHILSLHVVCHTFWDGICVIQIWLLTSFCTNLPTPIAHFSWSTGCCLVFYPGLSSPAVSSWCLSQGLWARAPWSDLSFLSLGGTGIGLT